MFRFLLAPILALTLLGSSNAAAQTTSDPPIEYKLAVIQTGAYVDPNDPLVGQFATALDDLQSKCTEPRDRLGDFAVVTHTQMGLHGVNETQLSILEHVNASIPEDNGNVL